jgi:hypothetical protein
MKTHLFFLLFVTAILITSCSHGNSSKNNLNQQLNHDTTSTLKTKPAATFEDTLIIKYPSAVFYYPDSLQLEKIKRVTNATIHASNMHESTYQIHNAHLVIEKTWPQLKIIEAKNYRYLLFIKKDGSENLIDLNTMNDAFGLFVFNKKKEPLVIDMTNIETGISFYLMED